MSEPFDQFHPSMCAWNTDTRLDLALRFINEHGHAERFDRWVDAIAREELQETNEADFTPDAD
jgi:hypothetical protein